MEINDYVGKFVKVGEHYGMISNKAGNRLVFIWSGKEDWTGSLVEVEETEVLKSTDDIQKARLSAKNYLLRERASLKARIAMKLKNDDMVMLNELLDFVVGWISRLGE